MLVTTGQLEKPETISKRVADTGTLILEFVLNPPSSRRAQEAITRMNWLHQRHQQAGKIRNPELLYTLSLFALEPMRWITKYEWRELTDLERCAHGSLWKHIGDAMNIDYSPLPSSRSSELNRQRGTWTDGLSWLEELSAWSIEYENTHIRIAESNKKLSFASIDLLMINLPFTSWKRAGRLAYSALISDELRAAIQ